MPGRSSPSAAQENQRTRRPKIRSTDRRENQNTTTHQQQRKQDRDAGESKSQRSRADDERGAKAGKENQRRRPGNVESKNLAMMRVLPPSFDGDDGRQHDRRR